ncbi:hypothetical protein [Mucilaginibacter terrenus]|nr:hypothetical protein [Mucilaginibacter terrenus]
MKKIALLLALIASSTSYAQTLINKKDDFTGKLIKGATVNFVAANNVNFMESLTFMQNDDKVLVGLLMNMPSGEFGAYQGLDVNNMSILIKMPSDSIIRFNPDGNSKIVNSGSSSMLLISSEITPAQLNYFANNQIAALRLALRKDDFGIDLTVKDKQKKQIQKAAAFMVSEEKN